MTKTKDIGNEGNTKTCGIHQLRFPSIMFLDYKRKYPFMRCKGACISSILYFIKDGLKSSSFLEFILSALVEFNGQRELGLE